MTEKNTRRVAAQKKAPITVIIGNPPYNAWQVDENDGNRNRRYEVVDERVSKTYAQASNATLVNALGDPYVKAFRWATDRLGEEGVLAYVSNNSYVAQLAFDGMRQHLAKDFDALYVLDLGGNVRKNPKLSGTTHNVFGIQVGVAVGLFVRRKKKEGATRSAEIFYARTGEDWRKERKFDFLDEHGTAGNVQWQRLEPDAKHTWLTEGLRADFDSFLPLTGEPGKKGAEPKAVFSLISNGIKSNNDAYVFGFDKAEVARRAKAMVDAYNAELARWKASKKTESVDAFVQVDERVLKWIRRTKRCLVREEQASFVGERVVASLYRPFVKVNLFLDRMFSEDVYSLPDIFSSRHPSPMAIVLSGAGMRAPFSSFMTALVPEQHLCASSDAFQVMPLSLVGDDGKPRDNVTDWALKQFRAHYQDPKITKWEIFHYVYGLLHHPEYRTRYEANLKRELPRIPFAPDFRAFARVGERLAELHLGYEQQDEYPLRRVENPDLPLDWRVERMRLSKDRGSIVYNEFLTLAGVPEGAFEYRLGNRSALEWIIDQYRVSTDKRSGIRDDPNRADDPEYIVRLIGQVVTVSLETMRIVGSLPPLEAEMSDQAPPRTPLAQQAAALKTLKEGWHEPGTPPPDSNLLDLFVGFLEGASAAADLSAPYLYATLDGGAQAEWSLAGWELAATVTLGRPSVRLHATATQERRHVAREVALGEDGPAAFAAFVAELKAPERSHAR